MAESIKPQSPAGGSSAVVPVVPAVDPSPVTFTSSSSPVSASTSTPTSTASSKPKPPLRQKYSLPLPVRTFPLPAFYPNNPLSLVHLAVAWASQVFGRPAHLPVQKVYTGTWCAATRSVNVSDPASMNDLWCQGFFGKGSLSRSEPSWLMREKARERDRLESANANAASADSKTSEQRTNRRREERADTKWERGRAALEAIEKRKQEEAAAEAARVLAANVVVAETVAETVAQPTADNVAKTYTFKAPVGPLELLALPNSEADLVARSSPKAASTHIDTTIPRNDKFHIFKPPVGPLELLALPNSAADLAALEQSAKEKQLKESEESKQSLKDVIVNGQTKANSQVNGSAHVNGNAHINGTAHVNGIVNGSANGSASVDAKTEETIVPEFKRQKSVRFSSTVESTTFGKTDPPSSNMRDMSANPANQAKPNTTTPTPSAIVNKEHLQLASEEAFFLSYALGALRVVDDTGRELSTQELFWLFSENASFPPTLSSDSTNPAKSSAFITHYSVYHHFRSLGWTPRHGIKFGVDWLLYGKGPALDHAEFGVMVMPGSVEKEQRKTGKSWHWLHSVNRVLSTVYKSMVLVYVNVPAMPTDKNADVDVTALLRAVEIRNVMVRRWSSNRNRD